MLNFGIECELSGGTSDVLDNLGLDSLHSYHCDCSRCEPERSSPDWTAQEDCTADGEFISRILTYGTADAVDAINAFGAALLAARATHSNGQGLHIHVGTEDMTPESWVRFWRLWFRYQDDIAKLAQGSYDRVRSYNVPVRFSDVVGEWDRTPEAEFWSGDDAIVARRIGRPYNRASWVNPQTPHGTAEFRLWNSTRLAWRIHLAVGVSVALIQASIDGVRIRRSDERILFDIIGPHLNDQSTAAYLRATMREEMAA